MANNRRLAAPVGSVGRHVWTSLGAAGSARRHGVNMEGELCGLLHQGVQFILVGGVVAHASAMTSAGSEIVG